MALCLVLFAISLSPQPIIASEDVQHIRLSGPQTEIDQGQPAILTSSQSFSYDDVLQLELNSDFSGNIKIVAIDNTEEIKDTIRVTLEKRVLENAPIFTKTFLNNISITGKKTDGVLQLNVKLPEETEKQFNTDIKQHLQLNYAIKTPPDISVQLKLKQGDVNLHRLRGKINITNEIGDVRLDETLGNYHVQLKKGRIHGDILLTPGQNKIKTDDGSIELTVLDELAAPLDLTALGGNIKLLLPKNYPADIELKSEKHLYMINLHSGFDNNRGVINGTINDGGPALRLTATETISIGPNPRLHSSHEGSKPSNSQEVTSAEFVQPVQWTALPPIIDGNLSETAWLDATALHVFQNPKGTETAKNPTDVYLKWDARYFYIGVRAHIQKQQIPRVSQTQPDSPIWEDESVEILLDTDPETVAYSHLIINPIGALFDQWVTKEGFPNFRFAPSDIQRVQVDESVVRFKGDSSWKSNAIVATKIKANYWSLEIAIPHKLKSKNVPGTWLFNVHRKSQVKLENGEEMNPVVHREYSYWLPIYDENYPWWPHWKEGMGKLKLIPQQPTLPEVSEVSEKFKVAAVEIEGNSTVPTEDLLKEIPIAPENIVTNEQLSRLLAELVYYDWFQEVHLKTVVKDSEEHNHLSGGSLQNAKPDGDQNHKIEELRNPEPLSVTVQISLTEAPVKFAKQVTIKGNKSFPAKFIKDWLDIRPGFVAIANVNLKQRMINDFYVNRGFQFAKVTHDFVNDVLQYNISEGSLDEIRFTGNRRISRAELLSALNIDTEGVYFHSMGQAKVNNLHKELRKSNEAFKSVSDWHVQREGGKNILIVDIQEQSLIKPGWFPIVGYNRVHGPVLGTGGTLLSHYINRERLFGSLSLGVSSRILNYHFGIESSFFKRFPLTLGVGLFKLTDNSTNDFRLRPAVISLGDSFYGTSVDNYFQREGQHLWIANRFGQSSQLRLEFTLDTHENLAKSTDWSYLNRKLVKRGNLRIDTGSLKMVSLNYTFDTRDHKSSLDGAENLASQMILKPNDRTRRGWRGYFEVEIAGGDFTYNLYKFALMRYNLLFGKHNFNVRISGDFADAPLPRQRLLYLGGPHNIRGYSFNAFSGDKRILLNVEHRIIDEISIDTGTDAYLGWTLNAFWDVGQIWQSDENPFSNFSVTEFKSSIGAGFAIFISPFGSPQPMSNVFEIAVPLTLESSLRTPKIIWRLEQLF